ncbi:hypothetical protein HBNXHx_0262 [Haloferax volcanii]|nr:hypothetical protein HBNXHx_0262 [Haloferax alexandrinus]
MHLHRRRRRSPCIDSDRFNQVSDAVAVMGHPEYKKNRDSFARYSRKSTPGAYGDS